ncbi:cryptochrome/photolyase family protein [Azotobacter vinelandii]|uniref:cryptochrome/photolyase family protein n=1 Tax=Azotobacter vinelandii TaxID=354 RepID=UPI00266690A9|nr:FAD-binding domain-containing protein [Azotobacter vinelandii]WKN21068.1 deoxyribodipyrimidine photo-lyase [Azotobacter vinelandii]
MRQLIWLRSDLRVRDNRALGAAMGAGPILALYLLSPAQWRTHDDAPCKVDFRLRNLAELSHGLASLGVPLLIRRVDTWDEAPALLTRLCHEQNIVRVHVNDEYGVHESRRDAAVERALQAQGVGLQRHLDQLLFAPDSLRTRSGGSFRLFAQFRRACHWRLAVSLPAVGGLPMAQPPLNVVGNAVPAALEGFATPPESLRRLWPAGEIAAQRRLHEFVENRLAAYAEARDFPAEPGTSRLSPYLAAGVLSPRQCLHAVLRTGGFDRPEASAWFDELLWREFYKHILAGHPRVSMGRALRTETEALPWRDAPQELAAWQQGRTGFPLIDAAMRQLLATGWMHNRLRMVVAMFLSKNLLIDWRHGERWFMHHLIDGDLAANNGGWQWCASTGTDAVPYFRLFNPLAQSRRFDPEGRFIRQWLPELASLDNRDIHAPAGALRPAGYPPPIVDLPSSRERALAAFKALRRRG